MSAAPGPSAAPAPTARQRRSRWALWAAVMLLVGIGFVLLFLLAQATNNRLLYERDEDYVAMLHQCSKIYVLDELGVFFIEEEGLTAEVIQ